MASAPPAVAIEVPTFTTAESCELIMNITNREISTEDEILAARELSDKLGGLALAIDIIAKQIKTSERFKTIRDFLPYYDQHHRALHQRPEIGLLDPYYSKDIDNVWRAAFKNLTSAATQLMSLFCFTAPEGIPEWILQPKGEMLPGWKFMSDSDEYDTCRSL